jgi:nucleoside-diphosphate-sugar epimerase
MQPGSWRHRTVVVTGASGFIGTALVRHLVSVGAKVVALSREARRDGGGVIWRQWDGRDGDALQALFAEFQPDFAFHLASAVTGKRELDFVFPTLEGGLVSAVLVLIAAAKQGSCKVVLAGSLEEPDPTDSGPVPASPYAASKWAAAGYGRMFNALYGLPVVVARIFMVYGPGQVDLNKFVPYVCLCAARGEQPRLMSGGRPIDWIFVDDVVDGLLCLGASDVADGRHVDLGSGDQITTRDVAERICRIAATGIEPIFGALPDRPMEQVRAADVASTAEQIGWTPSVSLDDGLERTYAFYLAEVSDAARRS